MGELLRPGPDISVRARTHVPRKPPAILRMSNPTQQPKGIP